MKQYKTTLEEECLRSTLEIGLENASAPEGTHKANRSALIVCHMPVPGPKAPGREVLWSWVRLAELRRTSSFQLSLAAWSRCRRVRNTIKRRCSTMQARIL